MNLPILSHIYTLEDRSFLLDKLEQLEQSSFSVKSTFEENVHEKLSFSMAELLLESAKSAKISLSDSSAIQQFLQNMQTQLKAIPMITVRLAFTPSNDLLSSISKWFDAECGMRVITSYIVDPKLIGGVSIELNGKYLDYSLKKTIEEKIKTQNVELKSTA